MEKWSSPKYQAIARGLRVRYPRVKIVGIWFSILHDGDFQQSISYRASLDELKRCGLLTEEMLLLEKRPHHHYGTAMGEGFHLAELDGDGIGLWELSIFTGTAPRERPRIAVNDARRELKRIFKTTNWKMA